MSLYQLKEFVDESGTASKPSQTNISHLNKHCRLPQQNRKTKNPGFQNFEYHGTFKIIHLNAQATTNNIFL